MKPLLIITQLLLATFALQAQHFSLSLAQGAGVDPNKNSDSLFFAVSHSVTQLRTTYTAGKLGLFLNANYVYQARSRKNYEEEPRMPVFDFPQALPIAIGYTMVNTINTALGLELCIPIIRKKAQLKMYSGYGISNSWGKSTILSSNTLGQTTKYYEYNVVTKTTGHAMSGINFNYKINPHLSTFVQQEYNRYCIPFTGFDIRKTPTTSAGNQAKQLFITFAGIRYTF
jgi:hypothetical protein